MKYMSEICQHMAEVICYVSGISYCVSETICYVSELIDTSENQTNKLTNF